VTDDVDSRQAQVLGQPPRLAPLPQEDIDAEALALIRRMRAAVSLPHDGPAPAVFATLCRNPGLFLAYLETGLRFMTASSLSARDRELAILRTAWLCGAPYAWGEHVASARKSGVAGEEIERITEGSGASGWSADDRVVLQAAEELHADSMVSDATWAALAQRLDEKQLIELLMLVGHYHKVTFVQNSLRFSPREGNPGLSAR
jgi:alkylhydroperoxidase family enzyme